MFRRLMCWLGRCTRCETVYDDPDGIGGRCLDCDELRAYGERAQPGQH